MEGEQSILMFVGRNVTPPGAWWRLAMIYFLSHILYVALVYARDERKLAALAQGSEPAV